MALKKQIVPLKLGDSAPDSGTDPKLVAGLTTVRDGVYDWGGRIAKRAWTFAPLDGYDGIPAELLGKLHIVGERMMVRDDNGRLDNCGNPVASRDGAGQGAGAAPLCDIGLTRYDNDSDGYRQGVSFLTFANTNVIVMSWSAWKRVWGTGGTDWLWHHFLRTMDKSTSRVIDEEWWVAGEQTHIELVRVGSSAWYLYHDDATHQIALGEIYDNGIINAAALIPAMLFNLKAGTCIDARPYGDNQTVGIGYISTDGVVDGYAEFVAWDTVGATGAWLIPQPDHQDVTSVAVMEWESPSLGHEMLFAWTNVSAISGDTGIHAIGLDALCNISMATGSSEPLLVATYGDARHCVLSGLQWDDAYGSESGDIYLSSRKMSPDSLP